MAREDLTLFDWSPIPADATWFERLRRKLLGHY